MIHYEQCQFKFEVSQMKKSYIKYLSSLLLFGSNGIIASYIPLSSVEIVFTRTLIGSIFLLLIYSATKHEARPRKNSSHLIYIVISGVAMGTSWMFLYEAYARIGVSIATLAYYCGPAIVMILAPILFGENISWIKWLGLISVLAGMVFVNNNVWSEGGNSWGLFCGIMSAILYAVMVIFNKKAVSIVGLQNPVVQLFIAFLTVTIFLVAHQGLSIHIQRESIPFILMLGIVNTGIGCYFYFSSIGQLPVQTVAIFSYLDPLSALVLSSVILGESLTLSQMAGAFLILGGAVFGEIYLPKGKLPGQQKADHD